MDIRTMVTAAKQQKPFSDCFNDYCPHHHGAKEASDHFPKKPAKKPKKKRPVDPLDDKNLTCAEVIERGREAGERKRAPKEPKHKPTNQLPSLTGG
ncbi:hypothetical protein MMC07_007791 [Pseudocyphellaria aurata]|nr:hypothetical protein [Pseudocyphellaria aurata]